MADSCTDYDYYYEYEYQRSTVLTIFLQLAVTVGAVAAGSHLCKLFSGRYTLDEIPDAPTPVAMRWGKFAKKILKRKRCSHKFNGKRLHGSSQFVDFYRRLRCKTLIRLRPDEVERP